MTEKGNQENARDNYLEAGKSANQLLIPVLVFVFGFVLTNPNPLLIPQIIPLLSLSVIYLVIHKMRQMYFFMDEINDGEEYQEREKFRWNIPLFLFYFYVCIILTFAILPFTILFTL